MFENIIGDGNILPNLPKWFGNAILRERYVVPILFSVAMIAVQIMTMVDFFINIQIDITRAFTSLSCTLAMTVWIANHCYFLINRGRFYSLFDEVEVIVGESAFAIVD